jgi:hypothetical protein
MVEEEVVRTGKSGDLFLRQPVFIILKAKLRKNDEPFVSLRDCPGHLVVWSSER